MKSLIKRPVLFNDFFSKPYLSDFNEETQQAIQNIEEQKNLTVGQDQVELYQQLGI